MKKNLFPIICSLFSFLCSLFPVICYLQPATCLAAIPEGYYSSIDGQTGDAIWEALYNRIKSHTNVGYDGLWEVYDDADVYPGTTTTWDIYSTCEFETSKKQCGNYKKVCDCQNREHTVPQSWFSGSGMVSDAFHVMPTDGKVNGQRSNYPYGECAKGESLGGKALGKLGTSTFSGYSGKVFEPDDEYKGDIARNYFYMITCYRGNSFTKSSEGKVMFSTADGHAAFTAYSVALLLKWHRQDPVSQKEIDRNNAVYKHQKNRNPYIDYPCLAEYIWGEHKGEKLDLSAIMSSENDKFLDPEYNSGCNCKTDDPTILYPKQSTTVSVGSASVGEAVSASVFVQGVNLTKSLSCAISGTNASHFLLAKNTITATEALNGYNLTVTYTPTATSTSAHTATLTVSSSELKSPRTITLTGESKAELVSPTTGSEFRFNAEGVGDVVSQQIKIKGTNLTTGIYIGIASGGPASFSVSPTSLTAAQANSGATITVTYKADKLGEETTQLIVNSTGKEFAQPSLTLFGSCAFAVKEPTNITSSSATLNWVNAGVKKYLVDVFFLNQEEDPEVVILNSAAGSGAKTSGYTDTSTQGYIRIGSSDLGAITYSGLDFSKGAKVVITARSFGSDAPVDMKVTINSQDTTIVLPAATDADYTINVAEGSSSSSTIKIESVKSKKRILVKNVKATTGGTKEVRTHLQGYPKEETYLFHTVQSLLPETEYTYTIQPDGLPESEKLTFTTEVMSTSLPTTPYPLPTTPSKFLNEDHLYIHCNGYIYNFLGIPLHP